VGNSWHDNQQPFYNTASGTHFVITGNTSVDT
jgi:hypothetical protein